MKKQFKWNISILVILILLACSLMLLLVDNFLKQNINSFKTINYYYKAYYISKAWLELSLAQINNRWLWFSYKLNTWDNIVKNFNCYPNCNLKVENIWKSNILKENFWNWINNCNSGYIKLLPLENYVIPLFIDNYNYKNNINVFDKKIKYSSIFSSINPEFVFYKKNNLNWWKILLSFITEDIWKKNFIPYSKQFNWILINKKILNNFLIWKYFSENIKKELSYRIKNWKNYLIITNQDENNELNFCIKINNSNTFSQKKYFAMDKNYIKIIWKYSTKTIWLEAIYLKKTLNLLVHWYISY